MDEGSRFEHATPKDFLQGFLDLVDDVKRWFNIKTYNPHIDKVGVL
jgi:hypothetical protein